MPIYGYGDFSDLRPFRVKAAPVGKRLRNKARPECRNCMVRFMHSF
jgi:hypothetical protein